MGVGGEAVAVERWTKAPDRGVPVHAVDPGDDSHLVQLHRVLQVTDPATRFEPSGARADVRTGP